jgi:hypothetical protein
MNNFEECMPGAHGWSHFPESRHSHQRVVFKRMNIAVQKKE